MSRTEFSREVKRAALKRSQNACEAVGAAYGLDPGARCGASLGHGVIFDHIVPDGLGGAATLDNCALICLPCNRIKTCGKDVPQIAKMKRQRDKHIGITRPKRPWPKRRMTWARIDTAKKLEDL